MAQFADQAFPHLTRWLTAYGGVEIGREDYSCSFVRAFIDRGMVWELDTAVGAWMKENGFDEEATQQ
jgi:hypothetical protein